MSGTPANTGHQRTWRKLHIEIDERSLAIRAVEITTNDVSDTPVLSMLLGQIRDEEDITSLDAQDAIPP